MISVEFLIINLTKGTKSIMIKLLKIKHWQLFGLLYGLKEIQGLILVLINFLNFRLINSSLIITQILSILIMGVYFGWLYTLGINLHKMLPASVSMNLTLFKFSFLIPCLLMSLIAWFLDIILIMIGYGVVMGGEMGPLFFGLILILIAMYFPISFIAKALKSIELQRPVEQHEYYREFFLILIFPIGIWFIQPRINKIFEVIENKQ